MDLNSLPSAPLTAFEIFIEWLLIPRHIVRIIMLVVFCFFTFIYARFLWQQNIQDESNTVRFNDAALVIIRHKEAVQRDSKSEITMRFVPLRKVDYTWRLDVRIVERTPEYAYLSDPFSQTLWISPTMSTETYTATIITTNPVENIDQVDFNVEIDHGGASPVTIPINLQLQQSTSVPLIGTISSLILFVITFIGREQLQTLSDWLKSR